MKPKVTVPLVLSALFLLICGETYVVYNYRIHDLNKVQSSTAKYFSNEFANFLNVISSFRLTPFTPHLTNEIRGVALVNLEGDVVSSYGTLNSKTSYKYSNIYKFVSLKGKYISLLHDKNNVPSITIASKTIDGKYIAIAQVFPSTLEKIKNSKVFLVDGTGFGVSLSGTPIWKNFTSLIAHKKIHMFIKNGSILNVKDTNFGKYDLVFETSFYPFLFSILKIQFIYLILLFAAFLISYALFYMDYRKKVVPILKFANFINGLKTFKKYEMAKSENNFIVNKYNALVDEVEKRSREYGEIVESLTETNSELTNVSNLLVEFSILFNDVKGKRKDLESALKIALRRMLDFSKAVNGLGVRYRDLTIYLGTVNEFNFERVLDNNMHVELKTDSEKVKFVVNFDRFMMNERLREMVKMLLYYITSFISMQELAEKSDLSARYDSLTGLLTRQEFERLAIREILRAKRENSFMTLIMMDIDGMKEFNDKYGHFNGDVLLKFVAKSITSNSRITDIACRYGEDEFLLCFVGMRKPDAMVKWKGIASKVKTFKYDVNLKHAIASYPVDGENLESLLAKLDETIKNYGNS